MNDWRIVTGIAATVLMVVWIGVTIKKDNIRAKQRDAAKIEKYNSKAINSIVPFCHDGYKYFIVRSGTHSGIAGVSPKVGPNGFVECE